MDNIVINILTIIICSFSSIFVPFTMYSNKVRETRLGFNPHRIKKEITGPILIKLYASFGIFGVLLQLIPLIFGNINTRNYTTKYYFLITILSLFVVVCILIILLKIGKTIARRKFTPILLKKLEQVIKNFVYRGKLENREMQILDLEELFDIKKDNLTLYQRIEILKVFLKKNDFKQ
ncbi:MAG: hypothetical protein GY714_02895 [Desulfobacterales bacterium]|nr:hypothetical protein [Desulfobacterales bacterium]